MKKILSVALLYFIAMHGFCQTYSYYVTVNDSVGIPSNINELNSNSGKKSKCVFKNEKIARHFEKISDLKFEKAFKTAKSEKLKKVYIVTSNTKGLPDLLKGLDDKTYTQIEEVVTTGKLCYQPNDFEIFYPQTAIRLLNGLQAWDITHGDPNIIVGISDTEFKTDHIDLNGRISLKIGIDYSDYNQAHGTLVAGCVATNTDNGQGITGIGFDTKLMVNTHLFNFDTLLRMSQAGARVLNASWVSGGYSQTLQDIVDEIYTNGTVFVASAGNQSNGPHGYCYPASYDRVISVGAVGHQHPRGYTEPIYGSYNWEDVVENNPGDPSTAYTTNDKVDICAPGFAVLTTGADGWYTGGSGTSFSSPQIAGICALILAVNPCLNPSEVESILKSTAANIENIPENAPYVGLVGAGRADAYQAVLKASQNLSVNKGSNLYLQNTIVSSTKNYASTVNIFAGSSVTGGTTGSVMFNSGSKVSVVAGKSITLLPGFQAVSGSVVNLYAYPPCGNYGQSIQYRKGDDEEENFTATENEQDKKMSIYPNPITTGNVNFGRTVGKYMLLNSTGEMLIQGNNAQKLDVSGLSKGMYLLQLDDKTEKLIIN